MFKYNYLSNNTKDTIRLGKVIAKNLKAGDVILLNGDLGVGKTTLVSGIAKGLGIASKIQSPTFNILKCYFDGKIPLYHIDAYRLENQNIELGLEEFIEENGITVIEWPTFILPLLPQRNISINISSLGDNHRTIVISSDDSSFYDFFETLEVNI